VAEAHACGYEAPVTQAALSSFERASKSGIGAKDCSAMPANWVLKSQKL
jgi:3-hydroxyisobutyrate dehydrogenase-like beta-hydroxyacid dehydrogenase